MSSPGQRFERLTAADEERLRRHRAVIERYVRDDEMSRAKYASAGGKLALLRAILRAQIFGPSQWFELQSMGIILGDAFVRQTGWLWRMVEDGYGRDPCVKVPGSSAVLFPLT